MLRIHSVTLPPDEPESALIRRAALKAGLREEDIREVVRAAEGFFGHE